MSNVGEKYNLVPSEIDLTGDGHGHHVPGTPYVYKHGWKLVGHGHTKHGGKFHVKASSTTTTTDIAHKVRLVDKKGNLKPHPEALRHYRRVTTEKRAEFYNEAGLQLHYESKSEEDLIQLWHDPHTDLKTRESIRQEIEVRTKRLSLVAQTLDQSVLDARREDKRDWFRKWDKGLHKLPMGKQIIDLRERLLTDKALDKSEPLRNWFNEYGKHYAKHVATAVAIGMLLHPVGLGVAGLIGHEAGREAVAHLFENMFVESGLAVALVKPVEKVVGPFFAPFSKEFRLKRAKKVLGKRKNGPHIDTHLTK